MDLITVVVSFITSGTLVALGVPWLVKRGIDHRLALSLTRQKGELDAELTRLKASLDSDATVARASLEATLREATERAIGEEAAERSYRFEAKKRLYHAVGPLRFQLVGASVQFVSRLTNVGEHGFEIDMKRYFGKSFLYRTGRLLALTELIERQAVHADFSVDEAMLRLLRFRAQVLRALSHNDVVLENPKADWTKQAEHIFRDQIPVIANSLIIEEEAGARVLRFEEFDSKLSDEDYLQPLRRIIENLNATSTPISWLRLIAIAEACQAMNQGDPVAAALDPLSLDIVSLADLSGDAYVRGNMSAILEAIRGFSVRVRGLESA